MFAFCPRFFLSFFLACLLAFFLFFSFSLNKATGEGLGFFPSVRKSVTSIWEGKFGKTGVNCCCALFPCGCCGQFSCFYRLVGLVVKSSASRAGGPGFESR